MKKNILIIMIFISIIIILPIFSLKKESNKKEINQIDQISSPKDKISVKKFEKIKVLDYKTDTVFDIKIKDYIAGVIRGEIPANFEEEAIKAQSVAAYTYLISSIDTYLKSPSPKLKGAIISTNPSSHQSFVSEDEAKILYKENFKEYNKKILKAVDETLGKVITYQDKPIIAAYHSNSSGITESAKNIWGKDVPYLIPVSSPLDLEVSLNKSSKSFSVEEVDSILKKQFPDIQLSEDKNLWFSNQNISPSGYTIDIKVGDQTLNGSKIRSIFSLKSSSFAIVYKNNSFEFETKGFGHGVGMSQYGANQMAKKGLSYTEILNHYYSDIKIKDILK